MLEILQYTHLIVFCIIIIFIIKDLFNSKTYLERFIAVEKRLEEEIEILNDIGKYRDKLKESLKVLRQQEKMFQIEIEILRKINKKEKK